MRGKTQDEIKRNKDKAKGTMKLLSETKKVQSSSSAMSPERTKGAATGTIGGGSTAAFGSEDDNPINMLLFGNKMMNRSSTMMSGLMSQSLGGTMNSNSNYLSVIVPLKHMLKTCEFTSFNIAAQNEQEKKPINAEEDSTKASDGLQTKIKKLLDQRKPPTESLPSLCDQFDDDLNLVAAHHKK